MIQIRGPAIIYALVLVRRLVATVDGSVLETLPLASRLTLARTLTKVDTCGYGRTETWLSFPRDDPATSFDSTAWRYSCYPVHLMRLVWRCL